MPMPTESAIVFWTAAAAVVAVAGQLAYVAYRFGKQDADIAAIKERVDETWEILKKHVRI